jgi:hypothetical protein
MYQFCVPLGEVVLGEFDDFTNVAEEGTAAEIAEVVHEDIEAPEDDFLAVLVLLSANVVEDADGEPHPDVVFASEQFGLAIVDGVLEEVSADSQKHRLV